MAQKQESPAGDGAFEHLAWRLDVSDYKPLPSKYNLRLSHLHRWHGLTGSRAALIADLVFDGGSR